MRISDILHSHFEINIKISKLIQTTCRVFL